MRRLSTRLGSSSCSPTSVTEKSFPQDTSGAAIQGTLPTARTRASIIPSSLPHGSPAWLLRPSGTTVGDHAFGTERVHGDSSASRWRAVHSSESRQSHLGCGFRGGHCFARALPSGALFDLRGTAGKWWRRRSIGLGELFSRRQGGRICPTLHRKAEIGAAYPHPSAD